jgi:lysophospholipase L1-like esterase
MFFPLQSFYYETLNGDIETVKWLIEQIVMSRPNRVTIDLRPFLRDGSGVLREEFSYGGLHLSDKGYHVWRDAIAPFVSVLCAQ